MQRIDGTARSALTDGSLVAGVLSGTSADGIDVALARPRLDGPPDARRVVGLDSVGGSTEPFDPDLAQRVHRILDGSATPSLAEVAVLHRDLGRAFGEAARRVADRADAGPLALVASHGQTVFHHDGDPEVGRVTLQLGDGDAVAEAAGCAAASDFRARDCAAGGEGAPLVALVDDVLFSGAPRPLAILNLGGIANWTLLREGRPVLAADAGPAGALLDGLARRLLDASFDRDGASAAAGQPDLARVEEEMGHPFLARPWPKTTGRDTFDAAWVDRWVARTAGTSREDQLATGVRFVARAAARSLVAELQAGEAVHVAVAGGGAHNAALMAALRAEVEAELQANGAGAGAKFAGLSASDRYGVPVDLREAWAFCVLGIRLALGEPSTSPTATGALAGRVLGKWSPAPVA
ncbi:MAG: anhydro-N-acetylmuramic acid kinase [Planctomycetota bacterium]